LSIGCPTRRRGTAFSSTMLLRYTVSEEDRSNP
jgi:hypothetical protein